MKKPRKIACQFYVLPRQYDQIKIVSRETKVPISVYLREVLDMIIEKYWKDEYNQLGPKFKKPRP